MAANHSARWTTISAFPTRPLPPTWSKCRWLNASRSTSAGIDVARLQPLAQIGSLRQVAVEVWGQRPIARGLVISDVRMQPGVEDEHRPGVFDEVGRNGSAYPSNLAVDQATQVHAEPATAEASNTHRILLSAHYPRRANDHRDLFSGARGALARRRRICSMFSTEDRVVGLGGPVKCGSNETPRRGQTRDSC